MRKVRWIYIVVLLLGVGMCAGCGSSRRASKHYAIRGKGIFKAPDCNCKGGGVRRRPSYSWEGVGVSDRVGDKRVS